MKERTSDSGLLTELLLPSGSVLELFDEWQSLEGAAHVGFWVFSLLSGALQAAELHSRPTLKAVLALALTSLQVFAFLFLSFYFDTALTVKDTASELTAARIGVHGADFLADPAHLDVLWGGLVLAIGLGVGRVSILTLKDRLHSLLGQYLDEDVREEILAGRSVTAQKRTVAVLFSDLQGFTTISEAADPQATVRRLKGKSHPMEVWGLIR